MKFEPINVQKKQVNMNQLYQTIKALDRAIANNWEDTPSEVLYAYNEIVLPFFDALDPQRAEQDFPFEDRCQEQHYHDEIAHEFFKLEELAHENK